MQMKPVFTLIIFTSLFFVGCAPRPDFRSSMDQGEETISFIVNHPKTKVEGFVAANRYIARSFNSAKDVIQMADKDAGMLIVKAVYPFSFPVDPPFNTQFWEGVVQYGMTVQVKDQKAKIEFITGRILAPRKWYDEKFFPKDKMPEIEDYYLNIKEGLVKELTSQPSDF